jgi:hypothetical protein
MPHRFAGSVAKLAVTGLALILGTGGLAVAGVDLPDPAQQAFERVGISLPNQAGGDSEHARSDEVKSVIDATPTGERGCEFGHRVAEAAKGSSLPEQASAACDHGKGKGSGRSARSGERSASAGSEFGEETAERARGQRTATPEERREFGHETADRNPGSDHPTGPPESNPGSDHPTGPPASTPTRPDNPVDPPPAATPPTPDHPTGPPAGTPGGRP